MTWLLYSAGVGRTGTLIAIDIALEQAAKEGILDIPAVVYKIRRQRMKMVQTVVSKYNSCCNQWSSLDCQLMEL